MTCPHCGEDHHQLYDESTKLLECYWCGHRYCADDVEDDNVEEQPTLRELGIDL